MATLVQRDRGTETKQNQEKEQVVNRKRGGRQGHPNGLAVKTSMRGASGAGFETNAGTMTADRTMFFQS